MTDWEARDKKITAGQIKGNIVSNACLLASKQLDKCKEQGDIIDLLKESADVVMALHRYVESLDVLNSNGATDPKTYKQLMEELKKIKTLSTALEFRNKNINSIQALNKEEKQQLKKEYLLKTKEKNNG